MTDGNPGAPGSNLPPPPGGGTPPPPPQPPQPAWQPTQPNPVQPPPAGGWAPGMPPSGPPPGAPVGAPAQPPAKNRKALFIGGGVVAALLAGGLAFGLTSGDDEPSTGPGTTAPVVATTAAADVVDTAVETTTAATAPPPADIDTIATSVVQLIAADAEGNGITSGSGTIISAEGLILTNAHVVANSETDGYDLMIVSLTGSADTAPTPTYLADVVAFDAALDLAVVQISSTLDGAPTTVSDLPFLPVGDSDAIGLGDQLRIFGFPGIGGDTITFTEGSVSGFTSEAGVADRAWVKTDATIAGGNSGGTAVNDAGELVAVPTRASATEGDVADCRVVQDTNGDNIVDENDNCIPIGGFINGLRPVNLAAALIEQGKLGEVVSTIPESTDDVDTTGIFLSAPVFSPDFNADDTPTEIVQALPTGATKVCGFFDYEGMTDGLIWDAAWSIDGEFNADYSLLAQTWIGGASGTNWWVCAGTGEAVLPDGSYELSLYVNDELVNSNTVFIGDAFQPVEINVVNTTGTEICYLRLSPQGAQNWGPDELGESTTIVAGGSVVLTVVGTVYDVLASDCDSAVVVEAYALDLTEGGELTLTP